MFCKHVWRAAAPFVGASTALKRTLSCSAYSHASAGHVAPRCGLDQNGDGRDNLLDYYRRHWDDRVAADDPTVKQLTGRIERGERSALAESITLVESRHPTKRAQGERILQNLLQNSSKRLQTQGPSSLIYRVAITGSPGAGKSTFIEVFGLYLIKELKKKVAVLTVDPSSARTGGSIMGDVARMTNLSREHDCYIRPSATSGSLGGVRSGTHESVVFCEGAGYDIVLIETVGVGQSESAVVDIADMVVLLLSPALGDELQGLKRGIMENVDLIVVTKADGDLANAAIATRSQFLSALHYIQSRFKAWQPTVLLASAVSKKGIPEVWKAMSDFREAVTASGELLDQRNKQMTDWMWNHVDDVLAKLFRSHPGVLKQAPEMIEEIKRGQLTPVLAAEHLMRHFLRISES